MFLNHESLRLKGQWWASQPFPTTPGYFWWGCFHRWIPMWDHERTCTEVWFPACKEQTQKRIHLSFCSVLWPKRTNPTRCLLTPQVPHATWFSQEDIYIRRLGDLTSDEGLYIYIYIYIHHLHLGSPHLRVFIGIWENPNMTTARSGSFFVASTDCWTQRLWFETALLMPWTTGTWSHKPLRKEDSVCRAYYPPLTWMW